MLQEEKVHRKYERFLTYGAVASEMRRVSSIWFVLAVSELAQAACCHGFHQIIAATPSPPAWTSWHFTATNAPAAQHRNVSQDVFRRKRVHAAVLD